MQGPDTAAYLIVAAFLFTTGALGVLIRRSPLIVLLSLEIMLNGANLALIEGQLHDRPVTGTNLAAGAADIGREDFDQRRGAIAQRARQHRGCR